VSDGRHLEQSAWRTEISKEKSQMSKLTKSIKYSFAYDGKFRRKEYSKNHCKSKVLWK
jgi:hypothetical protein